ncbi:hypothetical protein GCM10020219_005010 [Nonomuraea dietziae]
MAGLRFTLGTTVWLIIRRGNSGRSAGRSPSRASVLIPTPVGGFDEVPPNAKIDVLGHPTALVVRSHGSADRRRSTGARVLGYWILGDLLGPAEAGCLIALKPKLSP